MHQIALRNDFINRNFDGTSKQMNPISFLTESASDNETHAFAEMRKQLNRPFFENAMYYEVKVMFNNQIWEVAHQSEMFECCKRLKSEGKDAQCKQIILIWSFKRKRHPDSRLNKCKAKLCCYGGQQEYGINYWGTYAPVVSWLSVQTMLILSIACKLHS